MKVGDIFVVLGFKVDDAGLKGFDDGVKKLVFNIGALTAGATAALYAVDRFLSGPIQRARLITEFSKETGASTVELQKWIAVNEKFGVGADETTASIQGLADKLYNLKWTGQGAGAFAKLGITVDGSENPFDVLEQLREKLKDPRYSRLDFTNIMKEMGVSPKFIQGLEKSNVEFSRLAGNIAQTGEQTRVLTELGSAIDEIGQKLRLAQAQFVVNNMGGITNGIDSLYNIANALKDAGNELQYLWGQLEEFQTVAETVGAAVMLAWKPFFTAIALAVVSLQELKQFREADNSDKARAERLAKGAPEYQGGGFADVLNFGGGFFDSGFGKQRSMQESGIAKWLRSFDPKVEQRYQQSRKELESSSPVDVNVTNNITVHTSEDGESIGYGLGKGLGEGLQDQLDKTNNQINNGVNY